MIFQINQKRVRFNNLLKYAVTIIPAKCIAIKRVNSGIVTHKRHYTMSEKLHSKLL